MMRIRRSGRARTSQWRGPTPGREWVWWDETSDRARPIRRTGWLVERDEAQGTGTVKFRNGRTRRVALADLHPYDPEDGV